MKKIFYYAGAIATPFAPIVTILACTKTEKIGDKDIAIILSTKNNPFFQSLAEGAKKEAKKQGYKIKIYISNNDQSEEASKIDLVISQGYKTLIFNGLDAAQSATSAKKAIDAGIKVIAVDRPLGESALVWTTVSSNNIDGAKKLAKKVFKLFSDASMNKIKMLHLQGLYGEQNGIDRWNGFKAAKNEEQIVSVSKIYEQRADYDRTKANDKVAIAMTNDSKIKWVNADNDEMGLGALAHLGVKAGITATKVIVTGFDGIDDAIKAIKNDKLYGTVKQNPELLGQKAVQAAIEASGGKNFQDIVKGKNVLVETTVITKTNVNSF